MKFGVIGSGSWATALAKILTDGKNKINWWIRNTDTINYLQERNHNPHYLSKAYFEKGSITLSDSIHFVIEKSDVLVIAVPSAYIQDVMGGLNKDVFKNKKIISAVKGLLPVKNLLLSEFLKKEFSFPLADYFAILGPCHAEEVSAEKLSYLTFSGMDKKMAEQLSAHFRTPYINTIINGDIRGTQYAAVLKNIYALGAGIAHGLDYGDNFLSVYIANSANEMVRFLRKAKIENHTTEDIINYAASVYLGDLLVTCYSLYSRNRTFGNMIGKGYSVKSAQLELNMIAEGYNASRCVFDINKTIAAETPIADNIYRILWENLPAKEGFKIIESALT
ncbi:MAG: NAD(P)-binding domain-containing protein [Bacteroidetes bacterium]|nr:NAD(P)-binding domain-containing protein [Bacteroidota bacterium]